MNAQQPSQMPFEAGAVVGGKYRIVSLIGVGGVGRVFLARHIELDTDVAIKVLRPEMSDRPEAVQRFAREARASVKLRSERIARVLDVGTHEGKPYFVMEYMAGCSLLEMSQQANVDIATLCEFFIQACEGLADAHAQGVVHRDIKPENLFVVRDASGWRSLKVFDFGISKFSLTGKYSDVDLASMRTEAMMGTPHYISPEQIRSSRDVDHRTDIWSLGCVMFEVLSGGKLPFREEREVTALIAEVLEQPHRSLLDIAPNVPERLVAIVDRCLAKDRELRYQTTAEIALELLPLAPARARASAERAVSVMQAAGMMALNGDMESLRPVNVALAERPPSIPPASTQPRSTPAPSSVPPSDDATRSPLSGLRPSESMRALAAQVAAATTSPRPTAFGSTRPPMPSRPPSNISVSAQAVTQGSVSPTPLSAFERAPAASSKRSSTPPRSATPSVALELTVAQAAPLDTPAPEMAAFEPRDGKKRNTKAVWVLVLLTACVALAIVLWLAQRVPARATVVSLPASAAASALQNPEPQVLVTPAATAQPAAVPSASNALGAERSKPPAPKPVWLSRPAFAPPPAAAKAADVKLSEPPPPFSSPSPKLDLRRER